MKAPRKIKDETAREDDYRDYEERDIAQGWPYADEDGVEADPNGPYGRSVSNFDRSDSPGAEITEDPVIDSDGGPNPDPRSEDLVIADDDLEERIGAALEDDPRIDSELITVTVHDSVATLSGRVDTPTERVIALRIARSVPGTRRAIDDIVESGADSHIPPDANE